MQALLPGVYLYMIQQMAVQIQIGTAVFATGNPRSVIIYKEKVYIATLTPGALYAYSLTGDRMEDDDIILPSDIDPIRSTAITNDILTLVTVASGVSTLHMVDLRNNVSGQENTVITTKEISGASIQGATSQIFYPIQKINSEYLIQGKISNVISSSYGINGQIISARISSEYSIQNKISNVTSSEYSIKNKISNVTSSEYSIKNKISKTTSSEYLIQGRISNTYNSSYVISNALFFSTSDSISATGITFDGGYYWQLGFGGTVYAYNTDGTRSSENDFDLDDDNSIPGGITYHDNKFWIVDFGDHKVYVYNTDGSRASDDDFDLDADNHRSNGITYHDNKFWIVDNISTKVYAYNTDGIRVVESDFNLDVDNDNPTGITYNDDKFWVIDASGG